MSDITLKGAPPPVHFAVQPFDRWDKRIEIKGPGIDLAIDFDDVDHKRVERLMRRVVATLNTNWKESL